MLYDGKDYYMKIEDFKKDVILFQTTDTHTHSKHRSTILRDFSDGSVAFITTILS